jgi:probable O-glycosylation ligase (exosortase A-associated)
MLRSILLLMVYFSFIGAGLAAPFIATLGYVWLDLFQPQTMSYVMFLNAFPVAMIMGIVAVATYVMMDRRSPPPLTPEITLQILMAALVTLTSATLAVSPLSTWAKWDWAFKTLLFTAFVPFAIRSRVQIEAFVQIYLLALAANFLPFGAKVLLSGGGYGRNLGLQSGNGGLAEGGLLSTACLMAVPLALHLAQHARLLPKTKIWPLAYWGMAGLAVATAVGTFERSALIGLFVLAVATIARSKHKALYSGIAIAVAIIIGVTASATYLSRMSTIQSYQSESSAAARVRIWQWAMGFALTLPFGGGFQAYETSVVEVPNTPLEPAHVEIGRAYHSTYFEILSEEGFPGAVIFGAITLLTFRRLGRWRRETKGDPEFEWVASLCSAIEAGLAIFLCSGAFVSIGFQPMFWYFVAMSLAINGHMYHAQRMVAPVRQGWRATGAQLAAESPILTGWRNKAASDSKPWAR